MFNKDNQTQPCLQVGTPSTLLFQNYFQIKNFSYNLSYMSYICTGSKQIYRTGQYQMIGTKPFSILDHNFCYLDSMIHKQHHKDYQLWEDPLQKKQFCEYKLYGWPNEKQMEIYQFRKDQKHNLVEVHYLAPFDNAGFKQFRIFVENIPIILTSLNRLAFSSALYILRESLVGFEVIFNKYGYVHIDDKLIGLNSCGNVRVWLNQNFAYNGASQTHQAPKWMSQEWKATQMISTLFSIIEDRLQRNEKLKKFKKQKQLKLSNLTFQKAIQFINHYATVHEVKISSFTPQLFRKNSCGTNKKIWMKNQTRIKEPLVFKKVNSLIRRNSSKNKNYFQMSPKKKNNDEKLKHTQLKAKHSFRQYSPGTSVEGKIGTRPRNGSQATMSIAESKAKTSVKNGKYQKSPTKYFNQKSTRPRVQSASKDYLTLQSSLISGDMSFTRGNNHLRFQNKNPIMEQFQFTQVQIQNNKPAHKKRKFSAADQVTFHAQSSTPNSRNNNNVASSLARSMVIKQKQQGSNRLQQNPEQVPRKGLIPSKYCLQFPIARKKSSTSSNRAISPLRDDIESDEVSYKVNKPFLNYKAIKNSIINHQNSSQVKDDGKTLNLKNSFLKNIDMKSSEIILQRSSQYASLQDMMKPIKQSQAETPMSDSMKNDEGGLSELVNQKATNLFVTSVEKRRGCQTNISNSTTDKKSNFMCEKKEGLINFTSPRNSVKAGMFKSIFVGQIKTGVKQLLETDVQ